jgi:hypothetical protein
VNNDFYAGDAENWDNVIKSENIVVPASVGPELSNLGYAYAFSAPPYSLSALNIEINNLFLSIAEEIFCGFRCPVRIYQWSTCCSNYFDEGSEYWGSFLWTFEPLGSNTIVGIAASTTD